MHRVFPGQIKPLAALLSMGPIPSPLVLRRARESDLGSLLRLIHDTIDVSYRGFYPDSALEFFKNHHRREKILERLRGGVVLVFERTNRLIATGSHVGNEILGVFVSPHHQGKGLGRQLMLVLESHAKGLGLRSVTLSVSLPAERFYRALGYELLKPRYITMNDGKRLDYWEAWKIIP